MERDELAQIYLLLAQALQTAAWLAREGHSEQAMQLKNTIDAIKRMLCPHDGEPVRSVTMAGRITTCRHCGTVLPDAAA